MEDSTRFICPNIEVLPSGWQVKTIPGQCCPCLDCGFPTHGCYYNGVSYGQDQTWSDGCKMTCKCTDAARGSYQCNELCPQLNLPDVCHWEDAPPGKCCRRPICPSYIVIVGYPDV